ncbi:MAG: transcription antitermination factor NusB [Actinomycetes bacterium]
MGARTKARKRAVDALYEADQRGVDPLEVLAERSRRSDGPANPYTATLVEGVVREQERIDELISTYAVDWPLERMPAVDRAVLRLGVYELLFCDDVPDAVVIDEAVGLVKELSTDDSPGFVNGLLGRIEEIKPTLTR